MRELSVNVFSIHDIKSDKSFIFVYHALAYRMGKVPIKKEKIQDVIKLKEYSPLEHVDYYEEIYKWPTTDNNPDSDF